MTNTNDDHEQAFPDIEGIKPYEQVVMELTGEINKVKYSEDWNPVISRIYIDSLLEDIMLNEAIYHALLYGVGLIKTTDFARRLTFCCPVMCPVITCLK